jgi:hypothetical protein
MDAGSAPTSLGTLTPISRKTDSSIEQPFRFLDLPVELRIYVYEYLVLVGKVFYTPDDYTVANEKRFEDWKSYHVPSLQILRVCKRVHAEAEELYLSKNLFVLPDFFNNEEPFVRPQQAPMNNTRVRRRPLFSKNAARFLKNVSISFNTRQRDSNPLGRVAWEVMGQASRGRGFNTMSQPDRLEFVHQWAMTRLRISWVNKTYGLAEFSSVKVLEYLEVDLTNAYCPISCCRPHGLCFARSLVYKRQPAKLTFLGMMHGEEENMMVALTEHSRLSQDQIRRKHNILFNPNQDIWAKWKEPPGDEKREDFVDI